MTPEERTAWLVRRQAGIGASDVAALAGLHPWASPMSVWLDKTQPLDEDEMTEAQWLGLLVEDAILNGFEAQTGLQVIDRQAEYVGTQEWHRATPDGLVVGAGPVDAKFIGDAPWNDDGSSDGIPDHYMCQVQWQMHCTGHNRAYLVVIHTAFGRRQFRVYTIHRDQKVIDQLVMLVDRFWLEYVVTKTLPPVDGSDATADALKVVYPTHTPEKQVQIDPALVEQDRQAREQLKAAEQSAQFTKQQVQEAMGDAEVALVGEVPAFTWRANQVTRLDAKAIAEARKINPRGLMWLPTNTTTERKLLPKKAKK